ncbi:hypothetical protein C7E17_26685, partial [Stenotrophomonas maltophilia]
GDRQTFQVMPSASRGVPEADRRKRALSLTAAMKAPALTAGWRPPDLPGDAIGQSWRAGG